MIARVEGFSGTTTEDTWTKPRGRVEAREGGGIDLGWGWGEKRIYSIFYLLKAHCPLV